jgi:DNA-directed RNA polymerase
MSDRGYVDVSTYFAFQVIATENEPAKWTTPLGLPVVQPYCKLGRHFVFVLVQLFVLNLLSIVSIWLSVETITSFC